MNLSNRPKYNYYHWNNLAEYYLKIYSEMKKYSYNLYTNEK